MTHSLASNQMYNTWVKIGLDKWEIQLYNMADLIIDIVRPQATNQHVN